MKFVHSLPTDEAFFGAYARLIPALRKLGFLAQLIGGLTEAAVLYVLLLDKFRESLPPAYLQPAALAGAALGAVFLEIGLRRFTPQACRQILHRRFAGLHAIMTGFILATAAGLLLASGYLHLHGSKDLVKASTPPPAPASAAPIDSLHQVETAAIAARYAGQAEALKAKFAALVNVERQALQRLEAREKRTGRSYATAKERTAAKIAALEADAAGQLAALEDAKAGDLAQAEQRRQAGREKVEQDNAEAQAGHAAKVERYGRGLAGGTILCLVLFVLVVALEEVHRRGSGIEETPLPVQYDFSQSVAADLAAMLSEKWNYYARSFIQRLADKTPPPPMPAAPPVLYDAGELKPRRRTLAPPAEEQPAGKPQNGQQAQQGDGDGYNGMFERLFSQNGNGAAHNSAAPLVEVQTRPDVDPKFELAALILEDENYHDAAALLERAAKAYQAAKPRPVIQGFQRRQDGDAGNALHYNNALHYSSPPEVVEVVREVSPDMKPCQHCGQPFKPRTTWQKYCRPECREAYHAEKHGQPFEPAQFHKARRRKTGKKRKS